MHPINVTYFQFRVPPWPSFIQGRSRGLAAAQEPRQAFSLLILWNSLTNRAIWQWDLRGPKKLEGPVLIQKPKRSFLGGGGEEVSDICLLFCIDKCSIQVGHLTLQQAYYSREHSRNVSLWYIKNLYLVFLPVCWKSSSEP